MDPDIGLSTLLAVLALLGANAYFVMAEFALLTVHRARIEQQVTDGEAPAGRIPPALDSPGSLLLTAQLGSSFATLMIGFLLARAALAWPLDGPLSRAGMTAIALGVAVVLHATVAAQVPKLIGINHAGMPLVRVLLPPLRLLDLLLKPVGWPAQATASGLARLLGVQRPGFEPLVHTPEEIRLLVTRGHEQGILEEDEREMIHGVFEFSQTVAREVMTPRIDVVAVPMEVELPELIRVVVEEGHSRLPVYAGTIDTVVGVLLAKDLLPLLSEPDRFREQRFDIRAFMREPYFVPDSKPVDDILAEFRQQKVHLAIVLDEFGGTYGLLSMEDLLEEIVGEIDDEYDVSEPEFSSTPEGDVLIDGGASLSEVNERYGLALPVEDYDTIGGYVFGALGRVPVAGDRVEGLGEAGERALVVEETEERRILRVRLTTSVPAVEEVVSKS